MTLFEKIEILPYLIASGVSCMVASGILNPFDVSKARMQLSNVEHKSLLSTLVSFFVKISWGTLIFQLFFIVNLNFSHSHSHKQTC